MNIFATALGQNQWQFPILDPSLDAYNLMDAICLDLPNLNIYSSVPADTTLLRAPPPANDGDLIIDVSSELFSVQGQDLANAFAQIVWTVSEIPGVRGVRFRSDGVEIAAVDAEGTQQEGAVTKADYRSLAPPGSG